MDSLRVADRSSVESTDRSQPLLLLPRRTLRTRARIIGGRYRVFETLGRGAVGVVHRGRHRLTGREVALKLIPSRGDDVWAARFLREARLASEVRHPGVVAVLDAGWDEREETLYVVMERLEGETLARRMISPDYDAAEGLRVLAEVADALAAVHDAGVVHRDLKPENVFIQADGTAKLLDFGIAIRPGEARATATGSVVGTPLYMSPEQAASPEDVDARSDVWSFGVLLFEVLSGGRLPYRGENPAVVLANLVHRPPTPIRRYVRGLDRGLERLIEGLPVPQPGKGARPTVARLHAALGEILRRGPRLGRRRDEERHVVAEAAERYGPMAAMAAALLLVALALVAPAW